jgi:uncharacterized integral membrane protein
MPVMARARREWSVLVVGILAVTLIWVLVAIAGEVAEGDTREFDEREQSAPGS